MRFLSSAIFSLVAIVPLVTAQTSKWPACTKPSVRKEWRKLTKDERANWISAVNCLNKMPSTGEFKPKNPQGSGPVPPYNKNGSYYDDWVYMHMDLANDAHGNPFFFSWHRWYVQMYENALTKHCGLTIASPYWDWTLEQGPNIQNSTIFTDLDPVSGLGGFGDPNDDYQLTNGGFKNFTLLYPIKHRLRRQYTQIFSLAGPAFDTVQSFSRANVDKMVKGFVGDFPGLLREAEKSNGAHSGGHFVVGGDLAGGCPKGTPRCQLGPHWSANEPMFWLHHGMVDKVWADYQKADPKNAQAFGGSASGIAPPTTRVTYNLDAMMPADGLGPEVAVRDVISTTGGFLCYVYE